MKGVTNDHFGRGDSAWARIYAADRNMSVSRLLRKCCVSGCTRRRAASWRRSRCASRGRASGIPRGKAGVTALVLVDTKSLTYARDAGEREARCKWDMVALRHVRCAHLPTIQAAPKASMHRYCRPERGRKDHVCPRVLAQGHLSRSLRVRSYDRHRTIAAATGARNCCGRAALPARARSSRRFPDRLRFRDDLQRGWPMRRS
jgi:hypothetical protein